MATIEELRLQLIRYFMDKHANNTISGSIYVAQGATVDIGSSGRKINDLYVTNLYADSITGDPGSFMEPHEIDGAYHQFSNYESGYVLRGTGSGTAAIGQLSHAQLSNINADDHHDPVTIGANLTLTGQLLGLGSDVALLDENQTWTGTPTFGASANVTGALSVTGTIYSSTTIESGTNTIVGGYIDAVGNILTDADIKASGNILAGSQGTPGYTADVQGTLGVTGIATFESDIDAQILQLDQSLGSVWINQGAPSTGTALKVQAANDSHNTLWLLGRENQTGQILKITDYLGSELIVLENNGSLHSGNWNGTDLGGGTAGWLISGLDGSAYFNNIDARGTWSAAVFALEEVQALAGTQLITPSAGVVYESVLCPSVGQNMTLKIEHSSASTFPRLKVGDTCRIKALSVEYTPGVGIGQTIWDLGGNSSANNLQNIDVWFVVTAYTHYQTHQEYTVNIKWGGSGYIREGTAVVDYGQVDFAPDEFDEDVSPGFIEISAVSQSAPSIILATMEPDESDNVEPWLDGFSNKIIIGKISGLVSKLSSTTRADALNSWGVAVGNGFEDSNAPHVVFSTLGHVMHRVSSSYSTTVDAQSVDTGKIWDDGSIWFAKDMSDTDAFHLRFESGGGNKSVRDNLVRFPIGNVKWELNAGDFFLGSPLKSYIKWDQTNAQLIISQGSLQTGILTDAQMRAGGFSDGLYLTANSLGFWNASGDGDWGTKIFSDGSFKFGYSGDIEDKTILGQIKFDAKSGIFGGYSLVDNATIRQWWGSLENGKLYAGQGQVTLDEDGILIATKVGLSGFRPENRLGFTYNSEERAYVAGGADSSGNYRLTLSSIGTGSSWGTISLRPHTGSNSIYFDAGNPSLVDFSVMPGSVSLSGKGLQVVDYTGWTTGVDPYSQSVSPGRIRITQMNGSGEPVWVELYVDDSVQLKYLKSTGATGTII